MMLNVYVVNIWVYHASYGNGMEVQVYFFSLLTYGYLDDKLFSVLFFCWFSNVIGPLAHDFSCGWCPRRWTSWCNAATFEKSSNGTTPSAREQLLLRSCGVLLLISILYFLILSLILDCFADQWLPTPQGHPNPGMWKWYEMMTGEAMASAGCGGCRCVQYRSQHGTSETRFGERFWSTTHQPYDWMPHWCSITLCRSLEVELGHFGSPKRSREASCYDFFTVPRSKCVCSPRTSDWRKMALLWGWMIADGSSHPIRLTSWPSCFHVFTQLSQLLRRSTGYDPKPCFFLVYDV